MNLLGRVEDLSDQLNLLIEKAELWQLLFDECPMAVAAFDHSMTFFLVNNTFTLLTGFSKQEVIGEKIKLVLPMDQRKPHSKYEKEFIKNPIKKIDRHGLSPTILDKSGQEIPIQIDLSFINYDSKIYYVAFMRRI